MKKRVEQDRCRESWEPPGWDPDRWQSLYEAWGVDKTQSMVPNIIARVSWQDWCHHGPAKSS